MSAKDRPINAPQEDIAIVGMAGLYPGAADLQAYWQNIIDKKDFVTDPPEDWEAGFYFDPDSSDNDRIYSKKGGFLGDLARFDPLRHGVVPNSIDGGEPDQFLALELVDRALEDAGLLNSPAPGDRVQIVLGRGTYINRGFTTVVQHGVIVDRVLDILKMLHPEHSDADLRAIKQELKASLPPFNPEMAPGLVPNLVTGRVANRLDFMGVNYIVDAACASSLIAVDHSMQDLRSGRCDIAVTGGVQASTPAPIIEIFCQLEAISRKGQIRPFDRDADGTILAEGLGILILKRLSDAERDGDRIYALLKSVGTASDGRAVGLLAPRQEGEVLALQRAYQQSGVDPRSVGLVEAHGTGTSVGDASEIASLKAVFGNDPQPRPWCAVGTVKSMIGHCLPAAGSAGMIKTALALYHKTLPPTLHYQHPNPDLGLEQSPFYINTESRPWIHGGDEPRRAAVNAFGFGGINAHVVMEEYRGGNDFVPLLRRPDEVLIVEADSRAALAEQAQTVAAGLSDEQPLEQQAAQLNTALQAKPWRLAVVAEDPASAADKLRKAADKLAKPNCKRIRSRDGIYFFAEPLLPQGKVAFMFPGEGSQYQNMLGQLAMHFPRVRGWFDLIDRALKDHPRGLLPSEVIFPPPRVGDDADPDDVRSDAEMWRMDIGPEVLFAANQAVFTLLQDLGIEPDALVGHSTGEYSAMFAAKANRYPDEQKLLDDILALNLYYEELEQAGLVAKGQLISVAAIEREQLLEMVADDDLTLAMDNCPHQQVVCAHSAEAADRLERQLSDKGAIFSRLPFDRAYHTEAFQPFCERLAGFYRHLDIHPAETPLYSCMSTEPMPPDADAIRALAAGQWGARVRFRETIERMYADGVRVFIESGPRNNLCAFVDDILKGRPHLALPANLEHRGDSTQLNHLIAQLAAQGVPLDLSLLYRRYADGQPEPVTRRPGLKLKTGLQPMRLNKMPKLDRPVPAPTVPTPVPGPAAPVTAPALDPQLMQAMQQAAAAPSIPAMPASPGGDPVLDAWFQSMESFLGLQSQVMEAYLGDGGNVSTDPGTPSGDAPPAPITPSAPPAKAAPHYPMLKHIDHITPGKSLDTVVTIDLAESIYLLDHTIGRGVSTRDPELHALPVVPLTFTMELMAEAAAALFPGLLVVGMEEIRAYQWIALDQPSLALRVSAESQAGESGAKRVRVVVREERKRGNKALPPPPLIEGDILLDSRRPAPPKASNAPFAGQRAARWRPEDTYREVMFHGPRLQAIASMDLWGERGSEGTFVGLPHDRLFQSTSTPAFCTDAITLDNAGQLIGMWTADHLKTAFHVFPFRMEALHIYDDRLAPGETWRCRADIELVGDTEVRSDIDLIRADGYISIRLKGWWDKRFDLPERFFQLRRDPASLLLAEPRPELVADQSKADHLCCTLLDSLSLRFLESSGAIWLRVLAHIVLSRSERQTWHQRRAEPLPLRAQWLLGRAAVKDAIRELVRRRSGIALCPADIDIRNADDGHPYCDTFWKSEWGPVPRISLAHKGDVAIALAGDPEHCSAVGVDIERIEPKAASFIDTAFTATERELLQQAPAARQDELMIRLWCAKEAAAKTLHQGVAEVIDGIEVRHYDSTREQAQVSVPGGRPVTLSVQTHKLGGGQIAALTALVNPQQ